MRDSTEAYVDSESNALEAEGEQIDREIALEVDECLTISGVEQALALTKMYRLLDSNGPMYSSALTQSEIDSDAERVCQMLDNIESLRCRYAFPSNLNFPETEAHN